MDLFAFVKKHRFLLCFAVMLAAKVLLACLFSSDYQDSLFIPFVTGWLKKGGNPYELFSDRQMFPYPPLMLAIESVGGFLSLFLMDCIPMRNVAFKVPLFAFDMVCFAFLAKLFPNKKRQVTAIYSCSPILLYSTYMHGQLDIIPTALLTVSIYFLLSARPHRDLLASLFLSFALCTKFHIFAIVPVFFMFTAKRNGIKKALVYELLIPSATVCLCVMPFWGNAFVRNVLFNREQSVLTKIAFDFMSLKIYVPVSAVLLIYIGMLIVVRMSDELLYAFSAILFSVFLILVPPMPGWYVWILPFLVVFYIDVKSNRYINFLIYSFLNVAYIAYFVFAHDTDYADLCFLSRNMDFLKMHNPVARNVLFTILFSVHAYVIHYIYCVALEGNVLYRMQNKSFVIGISGDSGSGKSTLVTILESLFGQKRMLKIECDGDHKWERGSDMWNVVTHLNPVANFLYRQAMDVALLKSGKSVFRTDYNHATGMFDAPRKVLPKPYIVVVGLHSLYLPQLREQEDLKIYMDIDENLRRFWKVQRDVYRRGHSLEDVLSQIESRMKDFHKYIEIQKACADLLIRYFDSNLADCNIADFKAGEYVPHLSVSITAVIGVNLEPLMEALARYGVSVTHSFNDDMTYQTLCLESDRFEDTTIPVMELAKAVVPRLEYFLSHPVRTRNDMWSVIGVVLLIMIDYRMNKENEF